MAGERKDLPTPKLATARDAYDSYAKYYDESTNWFDQDLPFYSRLLQTTVPPFIEVGCGTGRVLNYLLTSSGANKPKGESPAYITGVDISEEMLEVCRRKAKKFIDKKVLILINHDLAEEPLPDVSFNAALVTFYVMNYIPEELQARFLENIYSMLNPRGIIAINLFYPRIQREPSIANAWKSHSIPTREGPVSFDERQRLIEDVEERELIFNPTMFGGERIFLRRFYISPTKGKTLLEQAGFTDVEHLKGFNRHNLGNFEEDPNSYSFTLIARK
ncbi:MAG: class I SAM-dependent methyltransferase [Candidatus Levybacteria bacterium]|nr:class I SAM-dependent methyltransferase [Candidatus Levybacteria bacterium]